MSIRVAGLALMLAVATLATTVLAITVQSQFVLAGLRALGAPIGIAETLRFTIGDIAGMTAFYGTKIAPAFLVAFAVTAWLQPRTPVPRTLAFAIAGASAIGALLAIILYYKGFHAIAGSRGWAGMVGQCAAGAAGGILFAVLSRRQPGSIQTGRATPM
jgi:hypothetical protein